MSASPERRAVELSRLLDDLSRLRLPASDWEVLEADLVAVPAAADDVVDRVSQIAFEANVQGRFHGGRANSSLPPTKQTSALPWVGLFCALLLLAVGGALGGGVVLLIVAALAVGVFLVAFAGSRVAHRTRATDDDDPVALAVPAPPAVVAEISRLRP
ncbi:hypothetical protein [Actinospongicola halichondriae]|uniref:hypothetical protein n=1 Tax=Actinospongicola halichondriae TaxID=3236844 RepID=UPI003D56F08E